jgi:hypothetical protein
MICNKYFRMRLNVPASSSHSEQWADSRYDPLFCRSENGAPLLRFQGWQTIAPRA